MSKPIEDFNNVSEMERRIYKDRRHWGNKTNSEETAAGSNYQLVEREYYQIYQDYFYNLLLTLITYENCPETLDPIFLEYLLRTYGYARIGGTDSTNIHVLGMTPNGKNNSAAGMFGYLTDAPFAHDELTDKQLKLINPINYKKLDYGYVPMSNKYSYFINGLMTIYNDFAVIDRIAKTLATIKATANYNLMQMKIPVIGYGKTKNITAMNIWKQINDGVPMINVDDSVGDINSVLQIADMHVQNFLPSLKDEWNNNLSELMTMIGINNVGVDKAERLVTNEANSNAQLIEASGNVYLDARNQQLKLINKVFGTNIVAVFNQESYNNLVELGNQIKGEAADATKQPESKQPDNNVKAGSDQNG